jgi:hypothetical protein
MNPASGPSRPPKYYVTTNGDYHFQRKLEDDNILNIYLKVIKSGQEEWQVQATTTLESPPPNAKKLKEVKNTVISGKFIDYWFGSWDPIFLKPACLNLAGNVGILDEIISKPDNITPEELGSLGHETLLKIDGFPNCVVIKSSYLKEITGQTANILLKNQAEADNSGKEEKEGT